MVTEEEAAINYKKLGYHTHDTMPEWVDFIKEYLKSGEDSYFNGKIVDHIFFTFFEKNSEFYVTVRYHYEEDDDMYKRYTSSSCTVSIFITVNQLIKRRIKT